MQADVPALKQLINVYDKYGGSVIALEEVEKKDVSRFGVVGGEEIEDGVYKINEFVEKPAPEDAPSNLAVVGKYIVTPDVMKRLKEVGENFDYVKDKEFRLADAFTKACEDGVPVYGVKLKGKRYDCGSKLGFLKATVDFGLEHPDLNGDFKQYLKDRCKEL